MSLFQPIIVKSYLERINEEEVNQAWIKFQKHFQDTQIQSNIKASKEEQYQEGFLRDLFVNVFGYTLNPTIGFNLKTEIKNVKGSKKSDAAILKDDKALAVIELKGMNTTDLSTIESQAFGYKNYHLKCRYVITSNFQKLRFYIDNAVEYEEFDLFKINQTDFKLLYLLLKAEHLINNLPLKIKNDSIGQEKKITNQLYKDYSAFKNALFNNLIQNNPQFDQLLLFQKTQKLLDRFLFIFFSEDRGLLSANTSHTMIKEWEESKRLKLKLGLYEHIKNYFGYLDTGYKDDHSEIYSYNGGLFKPDEVLDAVAISDDVLHAHITRIADYDFASEVDVGILGHIFEHSLTEIDEIKAKIQGIEPEKSKSKRNKDGVFYTPKYITNYIIENTIGKLCSNKKAELEIIDEDYVFFKFAKPKTKKFAEQAEKYADYQKRLQRLDEYRDWLLNITICDPACGSGAFLNEALSFLITEHRYIDELTSKIGGGDLVFQEVRNHILENNLFGVDINQESVEIAKLSLWLSTAEPHRKLSDLNKNIKCGNSLINDPRLVGEKAFDWVKEFPNVFEQGGFDVVIGNPPYVKLEKIKAESENLAKMNYKTYEKRGDLYVLFVEKGFEIIKENGLISFIMPNKWLQAGYGKSLRKYLLERNLKQLIDFGDSQVFEGATTYPCIFVAQKSQPTENIEISVLQSALQMDFINNVNKNSQVFNHKDFNENTWVISSPKDRKILEKLNSKFPQLQDIVGGEAKRGVGTGYSKAFYINKCQMNAMDDKSKEYIFPFLQGRDIKRYSTPQNFNYLIGTFPALQLDIEKLPSIKNHLLSFGKERLEQSGVKGSRSKTVYKWFETQGAITYYNDFAKPKILYQKFQVKPCFIFDKQGFYCNDSMWMIPTDNTGLLAVLNSNMGWWLISKYCTQIQNGYQLIWQYFGKIPIPPNFDLLSPKADEMLTLHNELQSSNSKLLRTLERKFDLTEISKNLQEWQNLTFKDFTNELGKKKIKLALSDEAELEDYFLAEQTKVQAIQAKIRQLDKEIDSMVYNLYDLTDEEIEVIVLNPELSD